MGLDRIQPASWLSPEFYMNDLSIYGGGGWMNDNDLKSCRYLNTTLEYCKLIIFDFAEMLNVILS